MRQLKWQILSQFLILLLNPYVACWGQIRQRYHRKTGKISPLVGGKKKIILRSFAELAELRVNMHVTEFESAIERHDWESAIQIAKELPKEYVSHDSVRCKLGAIHYECFKYGLKKENPVAAGEAIDRAYSVWPIPLYEARRACLRKRIRSEIPLVTAETNLLERPLRKPPTIRGLEQLHYMGRYVYKTDPERKESQWSESITAFKGGDQAVNKRLGLLLGEYVLLRTDLVLLCDLIVPVPGDPIRSSERGCEITVQLAQHAAKVLAMQVVGTYLEKEPAAHARSLTKHEILEAYFASHPDRVAPIKNLNVLLIDDVCTTGRTLEVCTRVLLSGGAKAVYAATLALSESSYKRSQVMEN